MNIGFTNVLRVAGSLPGFLTLAGDVGKGVVAVRFTQIFVQEELLLWVSGFFAVLGHNFSIYLGFKGGKGVATGFGVLFGLNPLIGGISVFIWGLVLSIWRYSSLGAIIAFLSLPFLTAVIITTPGSFGFSLLISGLILLKHTGNFKRLRAGAEPKIGIR